MSSMQSATLSFKKNLKFDSTERSRDRLRKRVEEAKRKAIEPTMKGEEDRTKETERKSLSSLHGMKTPRASVASPTRQNDGESKRGKKRITSLEKNERIPREKKELRARSSISPKEVITPLQTKGTAMIKKTKGAKGRPLGWRKEMKGMGYLVYSGLKKGTSFEPAKKIERKIVNKIKKKYTREVTPCPEEDIKGVGRRRKGNKSSPMKTRALQKKSEKEKSLIARCVLCRSKEGEMHSCAECNALYHLRKCCRYSEETASEIERGGRKRWLCARCTACALCNEYISDPHNVECAKCAITLHGKCAAKGGKIMGGSFMCDGCIKQRKSPVKGGEKEMKKEEKHWKRGRKHKTTTTTPKGWALIVAEKEVEEEKRRIEERDALYDQLMEQVTKGKNGNGNSPSKYGIISSSPLKMKKVALQSDVDLFEAAKAALAAERESEMEEGEEASTSVHCSPTSSHSSLDTRHQWIYVGSKKDKMKSIYSSPYPQEIAESANVFICPFCLRANNDQDTFRIHELECTWNCPPGNEIYRDTEGKFSFFEVDGAEQKLYCRRVCLVGKLFISSKTLVDEVETFLFYVLVEHTNEGCEFVGYFSKEKNPSKNNNLSCILTLPSAMRSGYGRLLIDLSYELSRIERKIGSPEHPLSDLGLIAYKGFWRSSILCYLRSLRGTHVASVKQISLATRIAPQDVINQLMRDGLLFYKDGVYFVNTEQRAYRMPLAMTRRKTIDHSKLKWQPANGSHEHLSTERLNYYV